MKLGNEMNDWCWGDTTLMLMASLLPIFVD